MRQTNKLSVGASTGADNVGAAVEAAHQQAMAQAADAVNAYCRMQTSADAVARPAMAVCRRLEATLKRLKVRYSPSDL